MQGRRSLLLATGGLALAGCGFQLRQPPRLAFASIALTGFAPRSPLASELREQLSRQVRVLEAPDKADVVLHALEDQRDRSAVASTATAEVRELQLGCSTRMARRIRSTGGRKSVVMVRRRPDTPIHEARRTRRPTAEEEPPCLHVRKNTPC